MQIVTNNFSPTRGHILTSAVVRVDKIRTQSSILTRFWGALIDRATTVRASIPGEAPTLVTVDSVDACPGRAQSAHAVIDIYFTVGSIIPWTNYLNISNVSRLPTCSKINKICWQFILAPRHNRSHPWCAVQIFVTMSLETVHKLSGS